MNVGSLCPHLVLFIDDEWIPFSDATEVWECLMDFYDGNTLVACNAAQYCIFKTKCVRAHQHVIRLKRYTKLLTLTMDFDKFVDTYVTDLCIVTIEYDPDADIEISKVQTHVVADMQDHAGKYSILLDSSAFRSKPGPI